MPTGSNELSSEPPQGHDERYRPSETCFCSCARAPSSRLTNPLLPSLQAYSNSGPSTLLSGTIAVHGCVHVDGSSIVYLYSIVVSSRRVRRSVSRAVAGLELSGDAPG